MRVVLLFGGRSGEHEVSVLSARTVAGALERLGHEVVGVGITRSGRWTRCDPRDVVGAVPEGGEPYVLTPDCGGPRDAEVVFPALHGPYGEDGCVQGLLELAGLPYVGAGVEGSAIGMNKVLQKRLFAQAGLPLVPFEVVEADQWREDPAGVLERACGVGFPCFTKPARLGSSVGITKVHGEEELEGGIVRALRHDDLVLVEGFGGPRELEVGILGEPPQASVVGEVVPGGEFYDYRAKYRDESTQLRVPADVPAEVAERVRTLGLAAFAAARCEGMARVDFFWDPGSGRLLVNELNSIPGLTPVSMFPRLWEAAGVPFPEVLRRLLDHALARHQRRQLLEAARAAAHQDEVSARG